MYPVVCIWQDIMCFLVCDCHTLCSYQWSPATECALHRRRVAAAQLLLTGLDLKWRSFYKLGVIQIRSQHSSSLQTKAAGLCGAPRADNFLAVACLARTMSLQRKQGYMGMLSARGRVLHVWRLVIHSVWNWDFFLKRNVSENRRCIHEAQPLHGTAPSENTEHIETCVHRQGESRKHNVSFSWLKWKKK